MDAQTAAAYPGFSTEINEGGLDARFNPTSSIVSDIVGGVAASVVDFGASVWNSLPMTPEVQTSELLSKISDNALRVYNENPDTIETASFIGGLFAPAGLALKGMKMLRDGSKAVNWFTAAGKAEDSAKVAKLFAEAGPASRSYKTAVRELYGKAAANQVLDAAAAEFAVLSTMNAHPMMEDYMADPVKNFTISLAGGAVLGAGIGHIADRYLVKQLGGKLTEEALTTIRENMRIVEPGMTNSVALQSHYINIASLTNIIDEGIKAGKNTTNDLTLSIADKMRTQAVNAQMEVFDEMISPAMRSLPVEQKKVIMDQIGNAFEMHGVNDVRFITQEEAVSKGFIKADLSTVTTNKPVLTKTRTNQKGVTITNEVGAIYYPDLGLYAPMGSQVHYGNASVVVSDLEKAVKRLSPTSHQNPNFDSSIELMATSAPIAQANLVGQIAKYADMPAKQFEKTLISNSDLDSITAIIHKLRVDPTLANAKVKVADKGSLYKSQISQTVSTQGPLTQKYTEAVSRIVNNAELDKRNHFNVQTDGAVKASSLRVLESWINGRTWPLHTGSTAFLARGYARLGALEFIQQAEKAVAAAKAAGDPTLAADSEVFLRGYNAFKDIYESNASKKFRAEMRKVSDNGYVYLYRGTDTSVIKGSAPLESMTTDFAKAKEFAKASDGIVNVYKIDVDDIIAVYKDIPGQAANHTEIMVRSSARDARVSMDRSGAITYQQGTSSRIVTKANATHEMDLPGLVKYARTERAERLDAMIANGLPPETIALRTNTPTYVVEAYMSDASAGPQVLERILAGMKNKGIGGVDYETGAMISTLDQAKAALDVTKKPLVLTGNLKKNPYIEGHANLDNKMLKQINDDFIRTVLAGSSSTLVKEWGNFMAENETMFQMLTQQLGKVNQELAGNRFFNSADFWARNMGEVGPIASAIGKYTQRMSNSMIGRVATPIKDAMSTISTDQAAVVEFTTFKNLNDSLSGYRKFDPATGRLMRQVEKEVEVNGKMKKQMVFEAVQFNGSDYVVATPAVRNLIIEMQSQSRELRDLHNSVRKIKGERDINDIGLWIPSFNPANKLIAYLHDISTQETKIIWANNMDEYTAAVKRHKDYIAESGESNLRVIERGEEQEMWSKLNGKMDPVHMQRADVGELKKGSAAAADIRANLDIFGEIIGGYEHYITTQSRNLVEITMSDTTFTLDRMSKINQWGFEGQPLSKVAKAIKQPKDPAESLKNLLTGSTSVAEYTHWKDFNTSFETGLSFAINGMTKAWDTATAPLKKTFFGGKKELTPEALAKLDYQKLVIDMKNRGITNPWEKLDEATAVERYSVARLEDAPDISKRIVYAGNALAATVALRIGEVAQPLVNIMSLPILTHLAAAQNMPATFMGVQKGTAKVGTVQIMYEGMRASNSPQWVALGKKWEAAGYFDQMVSEANDTLHMSRSLDKGAIAATERALDSNLVRILSKGADFSETLVRRQTMFTGAVLAKRLYPELDDTGVTIFARDFMDKAVGNFHAPQRPVLFQGTLGVALGLFQTYSLTLAQSMYRHLELKNFKELATGALLQSTIFGTSSMPGFAAVSNMIGTHFSEDHVDLETGTFRAVQDNMAEMILYGLPSQLGVGTHTRGDANFRIPGLTGDSVVAINFAKQFTQSVQQMADAVGNADKSIPQAFAEALSMQALSRPLARGAEALMGYSVTREGNTVQTPEEVWTLSGIIARAIGTRPLEEIKLRNAMHMNSFYGSLDYDRRQELMKEIKTRIRAGTLNESDVAEASLKYLATGGTPTGWRSAYARALGSEQTDGKEVLLDKLRPDSPLNYMINSLDGY